MREIEQFAARAGVAPSTVLQWAAPGSVSGATWARWKEGTASPTMRLVDRIRGYMAGPDGLAKLAAAA